MTHLGPEHMLARFVCETDAAQVPPEVRRVVRLMLATVLGTAVAGAAEDGVASLLKLLKDRGGCGQASALVFGEMLPAPSAALVNGVMCRALDYCDAMLPGLHIGSSLVPAALAAVQAEGGCSGAQFLAALVVGAELGSRFNLTEAQYDGHDPTGVAAVFAATAAACRIMRLDPHQTHHALALAFNRCGGSFQSNVDGSLAVRLIQGWVAETGVACAQLARAGFTGPLNFVTGIYGYAHLYGRDRLDPASLAADLGRQWRLRAMVFKKYPSCGGTQAMTEIALSMVRELDLVPARIEAVEVRVRPYTFKLVGQRFRLGENPRVDAQFSAQYCVASAFVRRDCSLADFRPEAIRDPVVLDLLQRITPVSVAAFAEAGQPVAELVVRSTDGQVHRRSLQYAPGFPGNELTDAEHRGRFEDCMRHAPYPLGPRQVNRLLEDIEALETLSDARVLVHHLRREAAHAAG